MPCLIPQILWVLQTSQWNRYFKQAPGITEPDQRLRCFTKFRSPNSQRKAGSYGWETRESESVSYSVVSNSLQPHGCSPPGSSVHGTLQARILEWVVLPFSRGSSWPRDRTRVSCIAGGFFTTVPPGKLWKPRGMFLLLRKRQRVLSCEMVWVRYSCLPRVCNCSRLPPGGDLERWWGGQLRFSVSARSPRQKLPNLEKLWERGCQQFLLRRALIET